MSGKINSHVMTVQEAVREQLRDAYHEEIRLFVEFTKLLGTKDVCRFEVEHRRQMIQDAAEKTAKLRTVLYGVLEGERILKERTNQLQL